MEQYRSEYDRHLVEDLGFPAIRDNDEGNIIISADPGGTKDLGNGQYQVASQIWAGLPTQQNPDGTFTISKSAADEHQRQLQQWFDTQQAGKGDLMSWLGPALAMAGVGYAGIAGLGSTGAGAVNAGGLDGVLGDSLANQPWWSGGGDVVNTGFNAAPYDNFNPTINAADGGSMDFWDFSGDVPSDLFGNQFEGAVAGGEGSGSWLSNLTNSLGLSPTDAFSLTKALAPLLGGALGYASGQSPSGTTTNTDVPDWLKPYYAGGLNAGLSQLGQSSQLTAGENETIQQMLARLKEPNAGLDAANKAMTDTASGKYLDLANNPQWQEAARLLGTNYNETIRPGTDAQFSRAGAFGIGNSAWEEMNARNNRSLATGLGSAEAQVWGQERDKQMNAAGAMPGFQNQYLTGLGNSALQLGNYQRTQPWQGILNYGQLLGNLRGPSTSTQQTTANPWQTAAGGAMTGYALSNLWK